MSPVARRRAPVDRSAQRPFEARRAAVENIRAFEAGVGEVQCFFVVNGPGQGLFDLPLPVPFTEMPGFSFGCSKIPGQTLTGDYPMFTVCVDEWVTENRGATTYWTGATLAVALDCQDGLKVLAHCFFTASALKNPVEPAP